MSLDEGVVWIARTDYYGYELEAVAGERDEALELLAEGYRAWINQDGMRQAGPHRTFAEHCEWAEPPCYPVRLGACRMLGSDSFMAGDETPLPEWGATTRADGERAEAVIDS